MFVITPERLVEATFRSATQAQKEFLVRWLTRPVGSSKTSIFDYMTSVVNSHSAKLSSGHRFFSGTGGTAQAAAAFVEAQSSKAVKVATIRQTEIGTLIDSYRTTPSAGFAEFAAQLGELMRQQNISGSGDNALSDMIGFLGEGPRPDRR